MRGAQCFNTWKCRIFSGMPAAAPYFFISRWSVVRSIGRFCFDRKMVPGKVPRTIFLSKQKRPIDRTTLHLLMKKYGAAAGIPEKLRHFHVLKHCCATHLLSKGFGVERVQD